MKPLAAALLLIASCSADGLDVAQSGDPIILETRTTYPDYVPMRINEGVAAVLATTTTQPTSRAGRVASPPHSHHQVNAVSRWGVESCGGSVDVCLARIGSCESTGSVSAPINYTARNPRSTAAGGWQFLRATWTAYGDPRWPSMADAPPDVQYAAAVRLFAARGSQPWFPSERCWRT